MMPKIRTPLNAIPILPNFATARAIIAAVKIRFTIAIIE